MVVHHVTILKKIEIIRDGEKEPRIGIRIQLSVMQFLKRCELQWIGREPEWVGREPSMGIGISIIINLKGPLGLPIHQKS